MSRIGVSVPFRLLDDAERAERLGAAARERVRERYLAPDYLGAYLRLIERILR